MPDNLKRYFFPIITIIFFIPYVIAIQDPFFWDTIQFGGKHGLFFYHNRWASLPDEIDSGHLPFLGYYLSVLWHFFGKSLLVSHLAMLPFLWIYLHYTYKISNLIDSNNAPYIWTLLLFEPCFWTQSTLVSPDVLLMAGFALMFYGAFKGVDFPILGGSILMVLAGNRGTAMVFAIGIIWLWQYKHLLLKKLPWLVPAIIIFCSYQLAHYNIKGWIGYHQGMPWSVSFERVDFIGVLKNIGLMVWRLMDTGRIVLCLAAMFFLFSQSKIRQNPISKQILVFLLIVSPILALVTLPYKYLTGHRYYMPIYFLMILFVAASLPNLWSVLKKRILYVVILCSFFLGHFLIYPQGIAMGWDSTLAYMPYQSLRKKAIADLNTLGLNPNDVGSYFPNVSGFDVTDLSNSSKPGFAKDNPLSKEFILISNVMNEIPDSLYEEIKQSWKIQKEWRSGSIYLILLSKK